MPSSNPSSCVSGIVIVGYGASKLGTAVALGSLKGPLSPDRPACDQQMSTPRETKMKARIHLNARLIIMLFTILLLAGCSSADSLSSEEEAVPTILAAATMDKVFSAGALYTCPMHPEVISADEAQPCPLCGMRLSAMDGDAVQHLREGDLQGCPMDPIIVDGETEEGCPVCGMDLVAIHPEYEDDHHGEHNGEHDGEHNGEHDGEHNGEHDGHHDGGHHGAGSQ